jgi:hypothetical protein
MQFYKYRMLHVVKTVSCAHPATSPMGTGGYFPRVKRQVRETHHPSPTSAEIKKSWAYISTPPHAFVAYFIS